MGVNEKLLDRMKRKPIPTDITMNDLTRLLESKGFIFQSSRGSHKNFSHPKLKNILTIVSHDARKPVKAAYIKLALEAIIELED